MDPIESGLRTYYEEESLRRLRPVHGERRRVLAERTAHRFAVDGVDDVLDLGAGPASDHVAFGQSGIRYVGVDLAVGNARLAAEAAQVVVPATLFRLPFATAAFAAGWSMSTLQHVPDDRIDEALVEFVRVLRPGAPVVLGLWGGRDEVIDSEFSTTGITLPRHFTLRSHDRIREMLGRHLTIESDETWRRGAADWEYHVAVARTPS